MLFSSVFLSLRFYPHFVYETLIPMHVLDLGLVLKGIFLSHQLTCSWPCV